MNALEIRKREAKVFILQRQLEDYIEENKQPDDTAHTPEEAAEIAQINKHIKQQ